MAKVAIISFVPVLINFGVWQLHRGLKRSKVKLARHDHRNRFGKRHNRVRVFCEQRRGGKTRDASRDPSFWNHLFQRILGDPRVKSHIAGIHQNMVFLCENTQRHKFRESGVTLAYQAHMTGSKEPLSLYALDKKRVIARGEIGLSRFQPIVEMFSVQLNGTQEHARGQHTHLFQNRWK